MYENGFMMIKFLFQVEIPIEIPYGLRRPITASNNGECVCICVHGVIELDLRIVQKLTLE